MDKLNHSLQHNICLWQVRLEYMSNAIISTGIWCGSFII